MKVRSLNVGGFYVPFSVLRARQNASRWLCSAAGGVLERLRAADVRLLPLEALVPRQSVLTVSTGYLVQPVE